LGAVIFLNRLWTERRVCESAVLVPRFSAGHNGHCLVRACLRRLN
jgi:hypothetical protein